MFHFQNEWDDCAKFYLFSLVSFCKETFPLQWIFIFKMYINLLKSIKYLFMKHHYTLFYSLCANSVTACGSFPVFNSSSAILYTNWSLTCLSSSVQLQSFAKSIKSVISAVVFSPGFCTRSLNFLAAATSLPSTNYDYIQEWPRAPVSSTSDRNHLHLRLRTSRDYHKSLAFRSEPILYQNTFPFVRNIQKASFKDVATLLLETFQRLQSIFLLSIELRPLKVHDISSEDFRISSRGLLNCLSRTSVSHVVQ